MTNAVGDIERRLEEDGKLSKEIILIKKFLEKRNVQCAFAPLNRLEPLSRK
jgi:hypothetical protein